jgi:hypothetical protein
MRKATRLSSATHSDNSATPDGSDTGSGAGSDTPEDNTVTAQNSHMPRKSDQTPREFTQQADFVPLDSEE